MHQRTLTILGDTIAENLSAVQALACILSPAKIARIFSSLHFEESTRILVATAPHEDGLVFQLILNDLEPFSTRPVGLINPTTPIPDDPGWIHDAAALVGCQSKLSTVLAPHIDSGDYRRALQQCGLEPHNVRSASFISHAVIIRLSSASFSSPQFTPTDWNTPQTFRF